MAERHARVCAHDDRKAVLPETVSPRISEKDPAGRNTKAEARAADLTSASQGAGGSVMHEESSTRVLSTPTLGLVWFGAAVSLAEILTGTYFAPLGIEQGLAAILVGHLIGGAMFYLVSLVSARAGVGAMDATKRTFGSRGSVLFSAANVLQLVGWTAIMIQSGAVAATQLVPALGVVGWCVVIAALIVAWIAFGVRWMGRLQSVAAAFLFALTLVVSYVVFGGSGGSFAAFASDGSMTFGTGVELAVAMPLSWLPVAGDYTRFAKRPQAGSAAATLAYLFGSCWMYAIGLGMALTAGTSDIAGILGAAGFGVVGVLIVVFSTVTTTFLDARSAGESASAITSRLDARVVGVAAAVVGAVLAAFAPVGDFEAFLYVIGSVFAPMAALVIADFFILKRDMSIESFDAVALALWVGGFVLYRWSLAWSLPVGNTLPVMVVVMAAAVVVRLVQRRVMRKV